MVGVLFCLVILDDVLCAAARRHAMEVVGVLVFRAEHLAYPLEWEAIVKVGGGRSYHRGRSYTPVMAVEPLALAYGVDVNDGDDTDAATADEVSLNDLVALAKLVARRSGGGRPMARVTRVPPSEDDPGSYTVALCPVDGVEVVAPPRVTMRAAVDALAVVLGVRVVGGVVEVGDGSV